MDDSKNTTSRHLSLHNSPTTPSYCLCIGSACSQQQHHVRFTNAASTEPTTDGTTVRLYGESSLVPRSRYCGLNHSGNRIRSRVFSVLSVVLHVPAQRKLTFVNRCRVCDRNGTVRFFRAILHLTSCSLSISLSAQSGACFALAWSTYVRHFGEFVRIRFVPV